MGSYSSVIKPYEIIEHRKVNTSLENIEIPARPENRKVTDKKGFIIFGTAILILLPFLIYCFIKSDIRHLTHYTDDCGNFCGENNVEINGISCSGKDYSNKPYGDRTNCLLYCHSEDKSVCGKSLIMDMEDEILESSNTRNTISLDHVDVRTVYNNEWWKFVLSVIITIGLSTLTLLLLRFMPAPVIWFIIILSMVTLVISILAIWFVYYIIDGFIRVREFPDVWPYHLAVAVIWTIIASIILIVFIVLFKRIGLVVQLYKETTKALSAMPLLLLVPIITAIFQIIVVVVATATTAAVLFARELYKVDEYHYIYKMTGIVILTIFLNGFVSIWAMRFIDGVQFMIVSGSVSTWYFAKNKDYLGSPICKNLKTTFKYHLGTIAFGSLLLTLFSMVKAILKLCCRNSCCKCIFILCCNLEAALKFLSENSYIQTGLHGQSFLRSAKRATHLLVANADSVLAINCVGNFVLLIIILILTIISTGISYVLFMPAVQEVAIYSTIICLVVNLIIVIIIFGTFQAITDTLFLCFCEDSVLNDGMARPYYMSRGLMEFVENSKKLYGK